MKFQFLEQKQKQDKKFIRVDNRVTTISRPL